LLPFNPEPFVISSTAKKYKKKMRMYKTIILPLVLYGCDTWSLTLKEEHKLRVFENSVLRRIFGPKRDDMTGRWRNCIMRGFIACTLHQV
jgi:hypothetical protein